MNKQTMMKSFSDFLDQYFGGSSKEDFVQQENVAKSVDEDKKLFTAVVLRPDTPDSHGDIYDAPTVEQACHSFAEFCQKGNLQHLVDTSDVVFVENWIAPSDMVLGEGEVKKGDWVATAKINDDETWELCKSGKFTGFSVGCLAEVENLNE